MIKEIMATIVENTVTYHTRMMHPFSESVDV